MIECVPNFSEGRDQATLQALFDSIAGVPGIAVLDRTSDVDHHRSVITFAGQREPVLEASLRAAAKAAELIDLRIHRGVHPRIGALDVLPFVPLEGSTLSDCVNLAHEAGQRIADDLGIPVYFYEAAALVSERVRLEEVRRGNFEGLQETAVNDKQRQPDLGGPALHPSAGAVAVGARKFLIAYNINLQTTDVEIAKAIARRIRASSGGLPCVKALGLRLASRDEVQVSINLTDFDVTPLHQVFLEVCRLAAEHGVAVADSELIGLMPRRAIEQTAAAFLKLPALESHRVVENRLEKLRSLEQLPD